MVSITNKRDFAWLLYLVNECKSDEILANDMWDIFEGLVMYASDFMGDAVTIKSYQIKRRRNKVRLVMNPGYVDMLISSIHGGKELCYMSIYPSKIDIKFPTVTNSTLTPKADLMWLIDILEGIYEDGVDYLKAFKIKESNSSYGISPIVKASTLLKRMMFSEGKTLGFSVEFLQNQGFTDKVIYNAICNVLKETSYVE